MGYWLDAALANKLDRGNRTITFRNGAKSTSAVWNLEGNATFELDNIVTTVAASGCAGNCGSGCSTSCHGCSRGCSGP